MQHFDFQPSTRVIFGENTLDQLGSLTKELEALRVLVVSDPGIASAGILEKALHSLKKESLVVFVFDDVEENPTTRHVEAGVRFAKAQGEVDLIVGLGGGSAMDCAKGINFLLTNGGRWTVPKGSTFCSQTVDGWKIIGEWTKQPGRCSHPWAFQRQRGRAAKPSLLR